MKTFHQQKSLSVVSDAIDKLFFMKNQKKLGRYFCNRLKNKMYCKQMNCKQMYCFL